MTVEKPNLLKGAAIAVAMRWTDRLIGFVSTLILARLLLPEDFGIVAMASLAVMLLDVLFDFGVHVALIQNSAADRDDYDTAWSIRLCQAALSATLIFSCAGLAGSYFGDPRVTPVLQVMALGILCMGFENIGTVDFQKHMQFSRDFKFVFIKRISGFVVTMILAFALRSYWAMVIGALAGRVLGVGLSYAMHPFRPRLGFKRFKAIFGVSQWILVKSLATYLSDNLHKLVVGRIASTSLMGAYTLADEISSMPTNELLSPINRVMLPAFSRAKDDPAELRRLFLLTQGLQALIGLPAGVGLALVAPEAVGLLLGANWQAAIPFIQILAVANALMAIYASGNSMLMSVGRFSWSALLQWGQVIAFFLCLIPLWHDPTALDIAWLRLGTVWIGLMATLYLVLRALTGVSLVALVGSVWRPAAGTLVMAVSVTALSPWMDWAAPLALAGKMLVAIPVYAAAVALLWLASGKPDGAEASVVEKVLALQSKLLKPRPA